MYDGCTLRPVVAGKGFAAIERPQTSETERRIALGLGSCHFYPPSGEDIATAASAFVQDVVARFGESAIETASVAAKERVELLRSGSRRREEFHGKTILQAFYQLHLHKTGLPKVSSHSRPPDMRGGAKQWFASSMSSLAVCCQGRNAPPVRVRCSQCWRTE